MDNCICSGYQLLHFGCNCKKSTSETIDYLLSHCGDTRWDIMTRAIKIMEEHFMKDKNE